MNFNPHFALIATLLAVSCKGIQLPEIISNQKNDFCHYVNPFIGTGGHGHTFPGATAPFGMIQPSPDTRLDGWDGCSGYHYSDSVVYGFSHTHLSGTGCSDYGDVLLMPFNEAGNTTTSSTFSHNNEIAVPGYYSVLLDKGNIKVELTASERVALHRYTFPDITSAKGVVIDLVHRDEVLESSIYYDDVKKEIYGIRNSRAWNPNQKLSYSILFRDDIDKVEFYKDDTLASSWGINKENCTLANGLYGINGKNCKAIVYFKPQVKEVILKVAISANTTLSAPATPSTPATPKAPATTTTSASNKAYNTAASKNQMEVPHFHFDTVLANTYRQWNKELSKIEVTSKDETRKEIFYTALYHCMIAPNLFTDIDGTYLGMDGKIHRTDSREYIRIDGKIHKTDTAITATTAAAAAKTDSVNQIPYHTKKNIYTVFSLWDTYRALHPLLNLIDKERSRDFLYTFITQFKQSGALPVWELAAHETDCMIGDHSIPVIYDAFRSGVIQQDERPIMDTFLHAMTASASRDKRGRKEFAKYGYIPADKDGESVSKTLEYAFDAWCIAMSAHETGKSNIYHEYIEKSQYWKNIMDTNGFMHQRKNGNFTDDFNPTQINNFYTEGNSWQYSTYIPHDFNTWIDMLGKAKAENFLDSLFMTKAPLTGREQVDVTGLMGQYAHGNEPSHHASYLYNYLGKPHKTQQRVRAIMDKLYNNTPDGLCGNDDCGQLSAWYVFSAIGFYPVCPGSGQYAIGSPVFDEVKIHLHNGRTITIICENQSRKNCYIQNMTNGEKPYQRSYISTDNLFGYDTVSSLKFVMGSKPNDEWCKNMPESKISKDLIVLNPVIKIMSNNSPFFNDSTLVIIDKMFDTNVKIYYTLDNSEQYNNLYEKPFWIKRDATVKAVSCKGFPHTSMKNKFSKTETANFYLYKKDKTINILSTPSKMYCDGGDFALIDGLRAPDNYALGGWHGYQNTDFDAVIDLLSVRSISNIGAGFLQNTGAWIVFPTALEIDISKDGINYEHYGTYANNHPADDYTPLKRDFVIQKNASARYVRIKAKDYGTLPEWHSGKGYRSMMFIDEVLITSPIVH
ncbi:MAG: GH92 family glycosyl hydrolase [Bacteroidales bacterium]|jgi:putative alpha-1,2-mannosidase|nr:GH92 family glycosyl hydrolase [Bacteroidales bacterium]